MTTAEPSEHEHAPRSRRLTKAVLGCIGCGGLGALGVFAVVGLFAASMSNLSGCDVDLSGNPGTGSASKRLVVVVAPATGLTDQTIVTVTSSAFARRSIVGVAVCLREADTERRGVDACDEVQGARYATDGLGRLQATYPVPRLITVGGTVFDCAERPGRCLVVAASADDYNRSGGRPITFAPGLEPVDKATPATTRPQTDHLRIGAQPAGPQRADTDLTVIAAGFQPGEPLLVAWCTDEFEQIGPYACEPVDQSAAIGAVMFRSLPSDPTASSTGIATVRIAVRATIEPAGDAYGIGPTTSIATSTTAARGDGRVDCRARPGRCSIVIAAAADTRRSAVLPYTVRTG